MYVHTHETVDHTLLRVAACSTTVVIRLSVACETINTKERVVTNRVAYSLYAGLMPQRQAITMISIYCSKPQQNDAVTPTPLAHRSHTACVLWHLVMTLPHKFTWCWPDIYQVELVPHIRQCRSTQNLCQTISQHELGSYPVNRDLIQLHRFSHP